ncbi:MAG: threonine synthase, partial [Bacteroidetes bacterium]
VIPEADIRRIVRRALDFPAPVVSLDEDTHVLELWHGPSLAFKDFGARFMAALMSWFLEKRNQETVILVATSGDTGGAVAAGFFDTPGIHVVILYPSGKVSPLQEKQLTTLGKNIRALEIEGTFDDCQALVKQAFLDEALRRHIALSSANSINIARLIPQSFYYFEAYKQLMPVQKPVAFVVPSGNFGNLTAGLFAKRMGLPVVHFVAATNANDVVPEYLATGQFRPRPSIPTISNAMDVGNPSNFQRMLDLYGSTWNNLRKEVSGFAFDDEQTRQAIRTIHERYGYLMDPHGAVGFLAWQAFRQIEPGMQGVILETAHPAKFLETMEATLGRPIDIPERLARLAHKEKKSTLLPPDYGRFKAWLEAHFKKE